MPLHYKQMIDPLFLEAYPPPSKDFFPKYRVEIMEAISEPRKHPLLLLTLIPGIAAAIKAWLEPSVGADGLRYLFPIHNWLAGQGWSFLGEPEVICPPGYGVTAWLFYQLWPDIAYSGIAVAFFSYALLAPAILWLFPPFFGRGGAWLAAVLVCSQPSLFGSAWGTMTETLYTLVSVLLYAAALGLWRQPASLPLGLAVGGLAGYGYLVRPEMMAVGGALVGLFLVRGLRLVFGKGQPWRATLQPALLAAALLAGCMAGYGMMLQEISGHFAFTGKGVTTLRTIESREQRTTLSSSTEGYGESVLSHLLRRDPQKLWQRWQSNFWRERHLLLAMTAPALLAFALGLAALLAGRKSREIPWLPVLWLTGVFSIPLPVYPFFMVMERYLIPNAAILTLALAGLAGAMVARWPREWGAVVSLTLIMALAWQGKALLTVWNSEDGHRGLREAGEWLATRQGEIPLHQVTAPRKRMVLSFFALNRRGLLPELPTQARYAKESGEELLRGYRQAGFTHLVLDRLYVQDSRELLQLWQDPSLGGGDGAVLLFEAPSGSFKIFRLEEPPPKDPFP